ncbi:MAG: ABC transporter permease, partial [Thermomicrobiales bacterium]
MMFLAIAIATISLMPVAYLLIREGVDLDRLRHLLSSPTTIPLIKNTIQLAFWVTVASVILGVSLAVLVVCTDLPGRRLWMVLFTLPLGVPAFVSTYTWVAAGYAWA